MDVVWSNAMDGWDDAHYTQQRVHTAHAFFFMNDCACFYIVAGRKKERKEVGFVLL
jgi:hypothetical protein